MDEEPLGDVLERYERSKALYKVLDAELTLLGVAVSELENRVLALEDELETIRPKSEGEILSEQESEELAPLMELRISALKLAEEEYFRQCEKIEAEHAAKAGPIKERFKRLEENFSDEDEVWISEYDWYKQNSPEYATLSEELRLLKFKWSEVGTKRTETRRELNASRDEKMRRLGK